ncbi:MAG TPA: endo-1,4-beta-xylanase [Polyangiaceae bacterium]|nr:endo-1,4-beta-xylanase [Polyangiaceae bacterium]
MRSRVVLLLAMLAGCGNETVGVAPGSGAAGASGGAVASGAGGSGSVAGVASTPGAAAGMSGQALGGVAGVSGAGGSSGTAGNGGDAAGGSGTTAGAGAGGQALGGAGGATACGEPTTLKAAAACTGRRAGVALRADRLSDPEYAERALQFNYVTPENEMKWDVTEPTPGGFDFTQGDAIVAFAASNGMKVKGHTLLWHNQLPGWLTSLTDASEVRAAMVRHIRGVMQHYQGKVVAWDVVNEAFDDNGVLRNSVFNSTIGKSFIEEAFKAAREADPDVKLYYNDYDIESAYPKADAVYAMVADLKARGVPIDGVGMQMHTRNTNEDPPLPELIANLERLLKLGVEVIISEMDVRLCADGTLAQQAQRFHDIVAACVARPGCGDVTVWGITDKYSFLNDRNDLQCAGAELPRPLLWDAAYTQKPAFDSLLAALAGK